jgi:hypothetical protein
VSLNACSLYDNSNSAAALSAGGSASISAYSVGVVGGVSGTDNIVTQQGIKTGIGPVTDPYGNDSYPSFSGCDKNNYTAKKTETISPGVYCGGIAVAAPLNAPAYDPNYQYQQVIILLSDGLNTQDRWYSSASPIDSRQQIACNNAKAAGVTIYTVMVMSGNSTVLQNCASDSSKYFALTDANSIITTFATIGTSLVKLHLSK